MTVDTYRRFGGSKQVAGMICVVLLEIGCQGKDQRIASDLVRQLLHLSAQRAIPRAYTSFCGTATKWPEEDRSITGSLTGLGEKALPTVERALDSIERRGMRSEFAPAAQNLMYAYATIKGPSAFPRLRKIMNNLAQEPDIQPAPDLAMAIALNLTSYADSARPPVRYACEEREPRYVLDQFILAWERNDEKALRKSLGPRATAAIEALQTGLTWDEMRKSRWHASSLGGTAVGYRLDIPGRWSEPNEKIRDRSTEVPQGNFMTDYAIMTRFTTAQGTSCGELVVQFHGIIHGAWGADFLVDNGDMDSLLRVVSSCAAAPAGNLASLASFRSGAGR